MYPNAGNAVMVHPADIDALMDVETYSSQQAIMRNMDGMNEFMKVVVAQPEVLAAITQEYRLSAIFQKWMEGMGFEDIEEFKNDGGMPQMQPTVLPDEQVQQQVQAGNLIGFGNAA
jgi:hypothetical protein